ncbi:MAG: helix-turn-helix domain-containing protein [Bryobacterales bacterium]|nr:helix-turn-helix domain-containing protein [Bryobacterales bacterium]
MENQCVGRQTYTVTEAGKILGIGRSSAYVGVKTGAIRSVRIGRRIVIPRLELHRLLHGSNAHQAA